MCYVCLVRLTYIVLSFPFHGHLISILSCQKFFRNLICVGCICHCMGTPNIFLFSWARKKVPSEQRIGLWGLCSCSARVVGMNWNYEDKESAGHETGQRRGVRTSLLHFIVFLIINCCCLSVSHLFLHLHIFREYLCVSGTEDTEVNKTAKGIVF